MKRGKLRHIVVDGKAFLWNYFYDDVEVEEIE